MTADKFGFYQVDNLKTYSKMEAYELANRINQPVKWNFNDEIYLSMDWRKEPSKDLWTMYKERAQQIRNKYDYIVIFYSGGSDSNNLLKAWMEADCKIDEIATVCSYGASNNPLDHMNAEITNVALPDIKLLQDNGIEFKFRLIDTSQYSLDIFEFFNLNYEYYVNRFPSINNPAKAIIRNKIDDYRNMIAAGKRLCFVWGSEKPFLDYDDGGYHFKFVDNIDNVVSPYVQERYDQGWYDELFYWSCDAPLIPIKQAHVIKNFMEICQDPTYYQKEISITGAFNRKNNQYLKTDYLKTLIYPKWSLDTFCNGKSFSVIFSERDDWFFNSNLDLKNRYGDIVKRMIKNKIVYNKNIIRNNSIKYYLQ